MALDLNEPRDDAVRQLSQRTNTAGALELDLCEPRSRALRIDQRNAPRVFSRPWTARNEFARAAGAGREWEAGASRGSAISRTKDLGAKTRNRKPGIPTRIYRESIRVSLRGHERSASCDGRCSCAGDPRRLALKHPTAPSSGIPRTPEGRPDLSGSAGVEHGLLERRRPQRKGVPPGLGVVAGGAIPLPAVRARAAQEEFRDRLTEDTDARSASCPACPNQYMPHNPLIQSCADSGKDGRYLQYIHGSVTSTRMARRTKRGQSSGGGGTPGALGRRQRSLVDVVHFTDQTRFDRAGKLSQRRPSCLERYRLIERDHIDYPRDDRGSQGLHAPWGCGCSCIAASSRISGPREYDCYGFKGRVPPA